MEKLWVHIGRQHSHPCQRGTWQSSTWYCHPTVLHPSFPSRICTRELHLRHSHQSANPRTFRIGRCKHLLSNNRRRPAYSYLCAHILSLQVMQVHLLSEDSIWAIPATIDTETLVQVQNPMRLNAQSGLKLGAPRRCEDLQPQTSYMS